MLSRRNSGATACRYRSTSDCFTLIGVAGSSSVLLAIMAELRHSNFKQLTERNGTAERQPRELNAILQYARSEAVPQRRAGSSIQALKGQGLGQGPGDRVSWPPGRSPPRPCAKRRLPVPATRQLEGKERRGTSDLHGQRYPCTANGTNLRHLPELRKTDVGPRAEHQPGRPDPTLEPSSKAPQSCY